MNIIDNLRIESQSYSDSFEHSGTAKQSFVNGGMFLKQEIMDLISKMESKNYYEYAIVDEIKKQLDEKETARRQA